MSAFTGFLEGMGAAQGVRQMRGQNALATALRSGDMGAARNAFIEIDPAAAYQSMQPDPKAQREAAAGLVRGVLAVSPEMRPQAWAQALGQAQAFGLDVSGVPGDYPGDEYAQMLGGMLGVSDAERTEFERLIAAVGPEQARQAIMVKLGLAPGADVSARINADRVAERTPQTQLAKLRADLDAGFIDQPQYDAAVAKLTSESGGITVSPDGTVQIGGGGTPKAPSGFTYIETAPGRLELRPIAGGPGEQISAEIAGRIALAEDSLVQLPRLIQLAEAGELTGAIDGLMAFAGRGAQGSARRDNMAAAEAITRMLTGAGMNEAEASREAELYIVRPFLDDPQTAGDKLRQLQRRLTQLLDTATRGRREGVSLSTQTGGGVPPSAPAAQPAPVQVPDALREQVQVGDIVEGPNGERLFFNGRDFLPIDE